MAQITAGGAQAARVHPYALNCASGLSFVRFRGSPILRAKRRGFLRNVVVALGNSKSVEAIPALIKALEDEESLVRGHAAWALGQIRSGTALEPLEQGAACETDLQVLCEIRDAISLIRERDAASG